MVGFCKGKSRLLLPAAVAILVAGVASCYPGDINSVGEADLVLTFFDPDADFETLGTYAMPRPRPSPTTDENAGLWG